MCLDGQGRSWPACEAGGKARAHPTVSVLGSQLPRQPAFPFLRVLALSFVSRMVIALAGRSRKMRVTPVSPKLETRFSLSARSAGRHCAGRRCRVLDSRSLPDFPPLSQCVPSAACEALRFLKAWETCFRARRWNTRELGPSGLSSQPTCYPRSCIFLPCSLIFGGTKAFQISLTNVILNSHNNCVKSIRGRTSLFIKMIGFEN